MAGVIGVISISNNKSVAVKAIGVAKIEENVA